MQQNYKQKQLELQQSSVVCQLKEIAIAMPFSARMNDGGEANHSQNKDEMEIEILDRELLIETEHGQFISIGL